MVKQTINVGVIANDRKGDPIRIAFQKTNSNFSELYTNVEGISADISTLSDVAFSGNYDDLLNIPAPPSGSGLPEYIGATFGNIVTINTTINETTPSINGTVIDLIPTALLNANGWIAAGTNNSATYPTVRFANGNTYSVTGTQILGDSGFLVIESAIDLTGTQIWPIVITSYNYSKLPDGKAIEVGEFTWKFVENSDMIAAGDIITGIDGQGGRFIQDCADGTTSMRWINVNPGSDNTQLIRAYTGDPKLETDVERAQIKLNWDQTEDRSGLTIRAFNNGTPYDWQFNGEGHVVFPDGSIQTTAFTGSADSNIWIETFASDNPTTDFVQAATSVEYDMDGNIIALFSHVVPDPNYLTYTSVAKLTPTGAKLWQARFSANLNTDGWGLAYDTVDNYVYIAGKTSGSPLAYNFAVLTKLNGADGSLVWSKKYDFEADSQSAVVDVDSSGNPIMVGYAYNGTDQYIVTSKIDKTDGSVIWCKTIDGQGDERAYGMGVGPTDEIVTVGYTDTYGLQDTAATLSVEPVSNITWTTGGSITFSEFTVDFTFTDGIPTFTNLVDSEGGRTVGGIIATVLGSTIGGVDGTDDMVVKVATLAANDTNDRMVVIKYTANGSIDWQKSIQFDVGYDCSGADAAIDSSGNIYVCGQYLYDAGGPIGTTSAMSLVKFDSSGVKQWSRRVVGNCETFATSVVVGDDGNLYLNGITGNTNTQDYIWVVAKYNTNGAVIWQRLLDNTTSWTFGGGFWFGDDGGGSNIAVHNGYVAIAGAFGDPFNNTQPTAVVVQIDTDATPFSVDNWDIKTATFSGLFDGTASDITVVNANKVSGSAAPSVDVLTSNGDFSDFLTIIQYGLAGNESLVNGTYSVSLGNTGTLTLPAGGTITEGYVTSNPTIQLTPASPDVASQKLVIKGGGAYTYIDNGISINYYTNTAIVGDTLTFYVNSATYSDQTLYWWIYPAGAGIGDSESGTVVLTGPAGSFSILIDSDDYEFTVRVSPEDNNYDPASLGVESGLINPDAPTLDVEHHLHLTTGDLTETSIFLGTDNHNVRTNTDGGVQITATYYGAVNSVASINSQGGYNTGTYTALSTTGGTGSGLTVNATSTAGYIDAITIVNPGKGYTDDEVITLAGGDGLGCTFVINVPTGISEWKFNTDGTITFPTLTVPLEDNANPVGTGQVLKFSDSTQQAIIFGPVSTVDYPYAERIIIQGAPGYTGTNGEGGDVYVWAGPGGSANGQGGDIKVRAGKGIGSGTGGYLNFQAGDSNTGTGGYINIESGESNTYGQGGDITIQARRGGEVYLRTYTSNGTNNDWLFDADGSTTLPGAITRVVAGTVGKTGNGAQPPLYLGDSTYPTALVDGNYGPFTLSDIVFTVLVLGGSPVYTITNVLNNATFTLNQVIGTLDAGDLGGTPGNTTNIDVATLMPLALDLTKSVNKLTNGDYTLADGIEGQIMYLVRQTGSTYNSIMVNVANARIDGVLETTIDYYPFDNGTSLNMSTLIFTDGAWQSDVGSWD